MTPNQYKGTGAMFSVSHMHMEILFVAEYFLLLLDCRICRPSRVTADQIHREAADEAKAIACSLFFYFKVSSSQLNIRRSRNPVPFGSQWRSAPSLTENGINFLGQESKS